jgi:hypothetical protein
MGIIERMGRPYMFRRFGPGRYVSGQWVDGDEVIPTDEDGNETSFSMTASVQRLTPQETAAMPEGQRSSEWIKVYTGTQLLRADESERTKGDVVLFHGREYEVKKIEDWTDTELPHYKALAVLLEKS